MNENNKPLADSAGEGLTDPESAEKVITTKMFHMCLDVRGALQNWSDSQFQGVFNDDGRILSVREAKDFLMDEIARGHRVIPIGDCAQFDFQTGCPGHPVASTELPISPAALDVTSTEPTTCAQRPEKEQP